MKENFDPDLLRSMVARYVAVDPMRLEFKPVLTGKFNTTYFVSGAERELVLRIAPPDDAGFIFYEYRMMAQEPILHALVRQHTTVPMPEILVYDDTRQEIDRDYIIMERLPGLPLTSLTNMTPELYGKVLHQVGGYLRQIHGITNDLYGYIGPHHPMEPQKTWAEAFRIMWNKMIDDIVETGHYTPDEAGFMRGLLETHFAVFDGPVVSRLLHMDIWHQNILALPDGTVTGILDMDRALWGDVEIEFAVLDYCGITEAPFWEGYGEGRDMSPAAYIRQSFYLLYEIQKYIVIRHWRQGDPVDAERRKRQSLALARQIR